uniref:tetratricopeptide repeat-containing sensor histidine kinase n=2 Tax=Gelidibacter sp. TaxID=2018083 RepID=UPI00404A3511
MKIRFSITIFTLLLYAAALGQDAKPDAYQDSLQLVIDTHTSKSVKKESLFLLGEYLVQRDPKLAGKIAEELNSQYLNKKDSTEIRRNNYIIAASRRWQGDYKSALDYYQTIYSYSKRQKDSLDIAKSGHFIGTLNMFLGNNIVSQSHLIEVASIYNKIGSASQKADINISLAGFYLNIDQVEKSKDQYLKALEQYEKLKDSAGMASANANLGMLYTDLEDFEKAEMHLMKQKALNKVFPTLREMGFHHDFLGLLRQKQGRLNDAYNEHLKALQIRENLSSTYNLCESKLNMGEVLIKLGRYQEAISHLKDVFNFEEHESLYQQQTAYSLLSEAYEKSDNYKESLANFKLYTKLSDSIYSIESLEIISEKDALYDKQQKDAEIALLNKEKEISTVKLSQSKAVLAGTIVGLVFFVIAIIALWMLYSKIKAKNQIITKALKDRDLLLHETHHRVKNNLQMISSLLNMQSKYVSDEKAFEVLQNGRNRVQSMAVLHKNLYAGEDLNMVNIQDYFEGLVASILSSYQKSEKHIKVSIDAKAIVMDIENVVPIGLIINELITNSLKHAFQNDHSDKPEIFVRMIETQTVYELSVKDNGVGIREDIVNKTSKESFGQRLINSLVQKLKATIKTQNNNGTEVHITIPKQLTK